MMINAKIDHLNTKRTFLNQYKKGVQQIFLQAIRFKSKGDKAYPRWQKQNLAELLTEHKTRNTSSDHIEVFSVAKYHGVINQIEHLGRSYAAEDTSNYKVVFPNDIVYTKSPTSEFPFGIIKQNKLQEAPVWFPFYMQFSNRLINMLVHC